MRSIKLARMGLALVGISSALWPSAALACGVCYGAPDHPLTQGMNMAILALLGITGGVLGSFVSFFLSLRKKAKMSVRLGEL